MEQLKKLKLKTTDSVKEKHFKQIEARLSQDAPPKPAILPNIISVAVILLVIFLAVLSPSPQVTTETGITKIYVNDMNIPSHSKWYVGVKETTNKKYINVVEHVLQSMEPIDKPRVEHNINDRFTVFTADSSKSYGLLVDGNYLMDMDTGKYYRFDGAKDRDEQLSLVLWDIEYEQSSKWKLLLLIGWLIGKSIIEKLYYPRDVDGHKLPRHSSKWQKVIYILTALTIVPMFYYPILMHYGLILIIVTLSILLQIWIETKTDNATWRKWMFLEHYWIIVYIYVLLGN